MYVLLAIGFIYFFTRSLGKRFSYSFEIFFFFNKHFIAVNLSLSIVLTASINFGIEPLIGSTSNNEKVTLSHVPHRKEAPLGLNANCFYNSFGYIESEAPVKALFDLSLYLVFLYQNIGVEVIYLVGV